VFEWNAINGEYTVNAGGKISVPLIGEVQASDTTTVELADVLAKRLQQRLNIAQTLNASIEIIKFRPFYIVGDVSNSGEYPFRPGMTVIQALSIAGGLPRSHAVDVHQIDRDVAGWTGELNQVTDEEAMLRSQMEQQEQLLRLAQQDKQQVESKQKTGLVTEQRYMASQRDVATAQTELLRLKIRLQEIKHKIATNTVLISESNRIAPTWVGAALRFSIIRPSGSSFTEFPADETTLVAPGDTIKVKCCGGEDPKSSLQSSLLGDVSRRR
jgi:protein involved in polysaccharide export with SLBB domain